MVYDGARHRVVLFGGMSPGGGFYYDDTWIWDGTNWQQVAGAPALHPSARFVPAMAYDAARQQVVLFGGALSDGSVARDTWVWDGQTWAEVAKAPATRPPERYGSAMAFDRTRSEVVLFGYFNYNDT
jgi:hypothetical protein